MNNLMKYFTFDWWHAVQDFAIDPVLINAPADKYEEYLTSIYDKLPERLKIFRGKYTIHDSAIIELTLNNNVLTVALYVSGIVDGDWGDNRKLRIIYEGVENFRSVSLHKLHSLADDCSGYGDLGYDELELLDSNYFEHRFLFSTGIEIAFCFSDFDFEDLGPNLGEHLCENNCQ